MRARMAKHTSDWWAERLKELSETGDARAVARRHGVRERTLIWWRSELRRRAREKSGSPPRLLPVVVRAKSPALLTARSEGLEIFVEVGAARITLRGAVSVEQLAVIVSASARAC